MRALPRQPADEGIVEKAFETVPARRWEIGKKENENYRIYPSMTRTP
jgi:hypothetical protein